MRDTSRAGGGRGVLWLSALVMACALAAGCGDGKDVVKTYPAVGKALCRGNPMQHALITLYPLDGEAKARNLLPHGTVGEDGSYTLGTYRVGDGAPAGRYQVTITWPNQPESQMGMPGYVADQLGGRYGDAKASKIDVTVTESSNTLPPIDLP